MNAATFARSLAEYYLDLDIRAAGDSHEEAELASIYDDLMAGRDVRAGKQIYRMAVDVLADVDGDKMAHALQTLFAADGFDRLDATHDLRQLIEASAKRVAKDAYDMRVLQGYYDERDDD